MADGQKMGHGVQSGGRRIDDHSFWAGSRSKHSVFPDGPHKEKMESSDGQAGEVMKYEDSSEAIRVHQEENAKKAKGHQGKLPQYRN
jgi:hypothetical protein